MKKSFLILLILCQIIIVNNAYSQLTQEQIDSFFKKFTTFDKLILNELFSPEFKKAVSSEQLISVMLELEKQFGKFDKALLNQDDKIIAKFEKATMPGILKFDNSGKVSALWFGNPTLIEDSFKKIRDDLSTLKGTVSVLVRKQEKIIFELNKDSVLGVGSSFKLFVLRTLIDRINSGMDTWDKTIKLNQEDMSFPSGILQNWPEGEPITLSTLANLMISISDNTATDHLIKYLGVENIEKYAPETSKPFYSTLQLFKLKAGLKDKELDKYLSLKDLIQKKQFLENVVDKLIPKDSVKIDKFINPSLLQLEWRMTTGDLCDVIESLFKVKAISINPGFIDKETWNYIGYKGGSEPGVLNYTYLLQDKPDTELISISATINNPNENVDQNKEFTLLIMRLINLLKNK